MSLGGLFLEGLIHGGAYFRNFTVFYNAALNAIVHQTITFFFDTVL